MSLLTTLTDNCARYLDLKGAKCPEPVMLIRQALRSLQPGDHLLVRCDDPAAKRDIPLFCEFVGHPLIATYKLPDTPSAIEMVYFTIQKKR